MIQREACQDLKISNVKLVPTKTKKNVGLVYLIPMLRTSPMETSSSIACHVVSSEIVVSMSSTPSSLRALEVVPTPAAIHISEVPTESF